MSLRPSRFLPAGGVGGRTRESSRGPLVVGGGGWFESLGEIKCTTFFVGWPEPRLLQVASLCAVVTLASLLAVFHIYLLFSSPPPVVFVCLSYTRALE